MYPIYTVYFHHKFSVITWLRDCTNNYNNTLGHNMFLTLQTIFTNWERWLTVKLSRPRQCMRCRGRFGFTRGFPEVILLKSVVFRGFAVIDFFVKAMFFCTNYNIGSGVTDNIKCDNSHTGEVVHGKNERVANHTKI